AMDHEQAAVAVVRLVEAVGEAGVDRKIVVGIGIHQLGRNCVEPLWRLTVALVQLRPQIARPPADRKGLEELEMAAAVLLPDFEFRLFLEDAHNDRRMLRHLLLSQQREQRGRQLLRCPRRQWIAVFAKARERRQCRGQSRRQHKRTDDRGADHCWTPDGTRPISSLQSVAFVRQTAPTEETMEADFALNRKRHRKRPCASHRRSARCHRRYWGRSGLDVHEYRVERLSLSGHWSAVEATLEARTGPAACGPPASSRHCRPCCNS